jgi:hypothetical protein
MRIGRVCLVRPSILVGSLAVGLLGCSAPASNTDLRPEGAPEILQVFATERVDGAAQLGLYYSGNAEYNANDVKGGGTADAPTGDGCGDDYEDNGDNCQVETAAADTSQTFRIIFDELLNGSSVEAFVCACNGEMAMCPNMVTASIDPSQCQDNPNTSLNEAGRWLDVNNDGMPDKAQLIKGIVSFDCGGPLYSTSETDGFYNPSGNQLIPVAQGLAGLGPALVITASQGLKTGSDCFLTVGSMVKDKQDTSVPALPATAVFHTEDLAVLSSQPKDASIGVGLDSSVVLQFNALIDVPTTTGIVLREKTGAVVVADATVTVADDDPTLVTVGHTANLKPSTTYEVVVPATIADIWGGKAASHPIITFTTGAM